ncbi:MAG: sigma-70 family RNA polymerase sigma factor [Pirellulales bacterium]
MKVKDRKPRARQARARLQAAAATSGVVRKKSGPKNRIERYFRDWPKSVAVSPARRMDRAEQLLLRRERARRIADLPLEYIPSPEFHKQNPEQRFAGPMPASNAAPRKVRTPAGLPSYLASLYETPLLTREQERHLFRKYNYLKYRAARLRENLNLTRPQVRLMDQIEPLHREAVATKNQIIQANLRLVVSIMKRYVTENDGTFELISEGNVSLMRAVEKFDYTRGFRFSTYASWAIQKNNAREFANQIKRRIRFQTSHDEALADCPQEHFDPLHAERAQQERAVRVAKVLARLNTRDRQIIEGRFGLAGNQEAKTLKEVGAEMGVSKERVRQLEQRAMERLRELAREANLRDALE